MADQNKIRKSHRRGHYKDREDLCGEHPYGDIGQIAAFFLFLASIQLIPNKEAVAILADAVNPKWQKGTDALFIGDSFFNTDDPVVLKSGMIDIEFNYGARVVVEGPAEFACKSDNMIYLEYGRIY